MDIKEKNDIFIDNANLQGRMSVFHDKLRKHLSNEYLFLSEKKDNLENEILQLKLEKEQKDKTLFPHIEKRDVRKYFSPLNINEKIASERRMQVGTGDRSERIRTYNFPQGRMTDHRIGLTLYRLEDLLNGNLEEVFEALATSEQLKKLAAKTMEDTEEQ